MKKEIIVQPNPPDPVSSGPIIFATVIGIYVLVIFLYGIIYPRHAKVLKNDRL